jgi:sec-independent protein translocase protein TatB
MFNVGGGELLAILLVALIVLGPQRLPGAARQVGRVMGDIRRISSGFQDELKNAFDADDTPPRRTEPVPLARAVADEDAKAGGSTVAAGAAAAASSGDRADVDTAEPVDTADPAAADGSRPRPLRQVEAPADDVPTIAPAVSDALDEIVGSAATPPAAPDGDVGEPGIGGERAAS